MIDISEPTTCRRRTLATAAAMAAVALVPPGGALLAAPGVPARPAAPAGAAAWRADHRQLPDPVAAAPAAVRDFFAATGRPAAGALAASYPAVVGALDGAPVDLRYAANRRAMAAAGSPYRGRAGRFLLFDPRGPGLVAQVFGDDLATADRIAVLVPGAGVTGANFWTGLGGRRYRSPAVQAAGLYRAATAHRPAGDRFAVIAWLGYRAPTGIAMAREDLARSGALALDRFVAGLVAVRPRATIALLGHSYGSTVIGLAAPALPRQVTDIAVYGSPGMGVPDAAALGAPAVRRVWAGQSTGDWIRFVPGLRLFGLGHDTKPADPSFGARRFDTTGVRDHDHYLSPDTTSLAALAAIAATGADR